MFDSLSASPVNNSALAQIMALISKNGTQSNPTAPTQGTPQAPLLPQQQVKGGNIIGQGIEGYLGGLMGGSGADGGMNSLGQGAGFMGAPDGMNGPFTASSSVPSAIASLVGMFK